MSLVCRRATKAHRTVGLTILLARSISYLPVVFFKCGYSRWSKLDADQTLTNMNIPFAEVFTNLTVSVDDRDNQLVPRFEGNLDISYMLSDQWGVCCRA